jgi:hypothetical protein
MTTKADLEAAWAKWTGDNIAEVRQRIRALAEADLLPRRKGPLDYKHLAHALLGFTAAAQHKDAAQAVRSFSRVHCSDHRFLGPSDQAVLLTGKTLVTALVASLKPPLRIIVFDVDTTSGVCLLTVSQPYVNTKTGIRSDVQAEYTFGKDRNARRTHKQIYPIHFCRKIYAPFIDRLLTDLVGPVTSMPASVAKSRPDRGAL